ncbi:MAG: 7-carboxy-7-deazaguanine synthase QueE [Candidatus Omnitrophica bacterium]|nr:7-carboxy-7-deazaguanine synthase QueE [Candidatus Omnitrophota bacterium]
MTEAKISEIFMSYQGEGPFSGSRQLFVRFFGCNLKCAYCDTTPESYKSFTRDALLGKMLEFGDDYNELAVTGGEPLLYADFLSEFLPMYRANRRHNVYIETNGTLPEGLEKVIDMVDIVAMDIKLPSSCGTEKGWWKEHKAFADIASRKELLIKAVVTDRTPIDDIKAVADIVCSLTGSPELVLQPVTPAGISIVPPDEEMMMYFTKYLEKRLGRNILVLGQIHRYMGIR